MATPGWYEDPWIPGHLRWWTGSQWSHESRADDLT
jgi:hypothetical protein